MPDPSIAQVLENSPTGSVFINNSSYSGADIQLVVHCYNAGETRLNAMKELEEDIVLNQELLDATQGEVASLETEIASSHIGTPEEGKYMKQLSRVRAEVVKIKSTLDGLCDQWYKLEQQSGNQSTKVLAEIQTISISTHRDKQAVRSCGRVYPIGFTRGQREIAGSLIFTVFNEHVLYELLEAHPSDFDATAFTSCLLDQLPPLDITIVFANEYGRVSRMGVYGVEFVNEGQTMSIEDIITENVVNYVARDFDPMRGVKDRKLDDSSRLMSEWTSMKASDLILEEDYQDMKNKLDPFLRASRRRNPYL